MLICWRTAFGMPIANSFSCDGLRDLNFLSFYLLLRSGLREGWRILFGA
jgi:hypothetical protein